jgi:streptogramin lyase
VLKRTLAVLLVLCTCGLTAPAAEALHFDFRPGLLEGEGAVGAPDGSAWVMDEGGEVAHVPVTGPLVRSFRVQDLSPDYFGLTWGNDGNLWMLDAHGILRYSTAGVRVPIDSAPAFTTRGPLAAAPDGAMWFPADGDRIGRVGPEGHVTLYGGLSPGAAPSWLCIGPDGNVWFMEPGIGALGRLTPSGQVTEFPMPSGTTFGAGITAGPDGNLYVALADAIARVSTSGILTAEFTDGQTDLAPSYLAAGTDGYIWFTEPSRRRVSRLSLDGHITHYADGLRDNARPAGLNRGTDGTLWFFDSNSDTTARIVIDPPLAVTTQAATLGDGRFRLSGLAAARGTPATVTFQYGPTTAYGAASAPQPAPDGDDGTAVTADTGPLAPGTTYPYRVVVTGPAGTAAGDDRTFTVPGGPAPILPGPPDADRDGYPASIDCNDQVAAIHPGAFDRPGDKIDQDCSGADAAYPRFAPLIAATWNTHKGYVVFSRFAIQYMPADARLTLTCHGDGCRIRRYTARISRARRTLDLLPRLRRSHLHKHSVVELRLSRPGYVATITRWTVGPPPRRTLRCLPPGAKRPQRCGPT